MARDLRIDVAYCVELSRNVDIQDACAEFFNQNKYERFSFLCSDETCRNSRPGGVRVTAVNHYRLPSELLKSPHYRELDQHADNCYWKELDRALDDDGLSLGSPNNLEDEAEKARRRLMRKVKRLISKFIIPPDGEDDNGTGRINIVAAELDRIRREANPKLRREALRQYAQGIGATATSLESLVSCFEELKDLDELEQVFTVEGKGSFTFRQAFRHVKLGATSRFAVYYGGAKLQPKRYGQGFVLKFIDQLEQKPITIYISPDALQCFRPSARMVRMIDEIQEHPDPKPYVRVYWIGSLENGNKGWSAKFKTLAHVVLRVVHPKAKSPTGVSDSLLSTDN
ncbi:MAG: hypothetical protein ACYC1F_07105 [Gallionellaceae bacterium]